jgi:hypothetical protein
LPLLQNLGVLTILHHHQDPQSNGKVENAVKTVKRLFTKCREAGQSEYLALLDWRNTPSEGIGTSPAQRFLGRRCKTRLPVSRALLQPRYTTEEDTRALLGQKERQSHYYNRHVKPLPPIASGDTVVPAKRHGVLVHVQVQWGHEVTQCKWETKSFAAIAGNSFTLTNHHFRVTNTQHGQQKLSLVHQGSWTNTTLQIWT